MTKTDAKAGAALLRSDHQQLKLQLLLASPRGFCAGVDRAIAVVNTALQQFDETIYVRHEVVHNRSVVDDFKRRGVVFVDGIEELPDNAMVIFSAHGVSRRVEEQARARGLTIIDATCPLVTKVHMEVLRHSREGRKCILIGHAGHPEVEGTMGRIEQHKGAAIYLVEDKQQAECIEIADPLQLAYVTQTTLSVDDTLEIVSVLRRRFPAIKAPVKDDICYATQNRQDAVRDMAPHCQVMLVVGSPSSSNSNRLMELASRMGCRSFLIDTTGQIDIDWFADGDTVGITAGASAPEYLVQEVVAWLCAKGASKPQQQQGKTETIRFQMPRPLR